MLLAKLRSQINLGFARERLFPSEWVGFLFLGYPPSQVTPGPLRAPPSDSWNCFLAGPIDLSTARPALSRPWLAQTLLALQ